MGLGSSLFVSTPFGRVAMFDAATYFLGPVILVISYKQYSRAEKRILILSGLWFIGACYSNWWRGEEIDIALKGNAIVFNVTCMLVVCIALLKKSHHAFLWFSVGAGIGAVLSFYVFQNGAYLYFAETAGYGGVGGIQEFLIDKQIFPVYASTFLVAVLFPLRTFGFMPWVWVIAVCVTSAFYILINGGSRSGFGIFMLTSAFIITYAYARKWLRSILRNLPLFVVLAGLMSFAVIQTYISLARSGQMGEAALDKVADNEAVAGRDDIIRAWPFLKNHPFVGSGSSAIDRWGYIEGDARIPGHSVLVGSWAQNGIMGLVFWCYVLYLIFDFIRKRMIQFEDWFPFLAYQLISMTWAILFSPFGGYRGLICMVLALCVVSTSQKYMEIVRSNGRFQG